ncbi:hypothetical protein A8B78_15075 [Jannaschia sp. EhC01]|nr:hypothetical protein A8B78_15075 [Jannaschia sp. EhC01]
MIILSPETVLNPSVLETRSLPKKVIGRVQILPRGAALSTWIRLIFEVQFLRYLFALLPFLALILFSRDLALPVTQAPLAMILVIGVVELKVLRLSKPARERLMTQADADRIHDAFAFRAKALLRRIAARRGIAAGELRLLADQSELARVAPLTFVSIQSADPSPHIVALAPEDREILRGLFDESLSENDLQRANLRVDDALRDVRLDAEGVSAHARLAAWMDAQAVEA